MDKKIKLIVIIIVCVLISAFVFASCQSPDESLMSTKKLSLADKLTYNEADVAQDMAKVKEIALIVNNSTDYQIVVKRGLSDYVIKQATIFANYLNQIAGADIFNAVYGEAYSTMHQIYFTIDSNNESNNDIVNDGFKIQTDVNAHITVMALVEEGLVNAMYTFLEDYLECMFVRDDFDYIPKFDNVYLQPINIANNPDFVWRKVFQYEVAQNDWGKKLKNNGVALEGNDIEVNRNWGTWCHNVFEFVDPNIYFESNPEYFAFYKGKRRIEYNGMPTQLCLTNSEIYPIIKQSMADKIAKNPDIKYWDFSINDNRFYCTCSDCQKVEKETGSMMGTMLPIINKLAKDFPDKIISTLAYFHNEQAPSKMTCEPNVNIVLAPIVSGQKYSYALGGSQKALKTKRLLTEWSMLSDNILIWDYVVNFNHLLLPYPNFDVQYDNLKLYIDNNVTSVFHQGSRERGDELACLRSYIMSRQLWDIDVDIDKIMGKYLVVTYGSSANYVAEYLETCNNLMKQSNIDLDLYDSVSMHKNGYLSKSAIKKYNELIDSAIASQSDSAIKTRLEEIKINVLYAKMHENSFDFKGKEAAKKQFKELAEKHTIVRVQESKEPTLHSYLDHDYAKYIAGQKFGLSMAIILPVLSVAAITFATFAFIKKKR